MVGPDSHRLSRGRCYLGKLSEEAGVFLSTGLSPSVVSLSRTIQLRPCLVTLPSDRTPKRQPPATSRVQGVRALAHTRFRLFPFRSPLLRKSITFSFPEGTEMFQFPSFAPRFASGKPEFIGLGFPIRKSPVQCLLDGSPGLIAAYHVLLRFLTPRYSLCTLSRLTTCPVQNLFKYSPYETDF